MAPVDPPALSPIEVGDEQDALWRASLKLLEAAQELPHNHEMFDLIVDMMAVLIREAKASRS